MDQQDYEKVPPPSYPTASQPYDPYPYVADAAAPTPYPPQQYPPPTSQYPPTTGQAPPGLPYGPPQTGYPPQQGYGTAQYGAASPTQLQQQPHVVVVGASPHYHPVAVQHVQSFVGHIAFACCVLWLCNWLFGLIAFILAMVASSTAVSDPAGARRLGNASIGTSIAGIIVTVVIIVIVVAVAAVSIADNVDSYYCQYKYYGICYRSRSYVGTYGSCSGVKSSTGYCYHN